MCVWSTSPSQFALHSNKKSMILLSATQLSSGIDCLQNWYTSSSSSTSLSFLRLLLPSSSSSHF